MGMYTEIYVNVDFKEETPREVIDTIKAMCEFDPDHPCLSDKPIRWAYLFCDGSFYTPSTSCANLTYNDIGERWSLLGKGDIKNYDGEIESFFEYIRPWVDDDFMGYSRYEEDREPTLYYKVDF